MGWKTNKSYFDYQQGQAIFLSKASTPFVGTIQFPIQWVPGTFTPRVKRWNVKLPIHLHLLPN